MKTFSTRSFLALGGACFFLVGACSHGSPSLPERGVPGSYRADGGMGYGSGNRAETDSTSAVLSSEEITADRGGMGYGSGN